MNYLTQKDLIPLQEEIKELKKLLSKQPSQKRYLNSAEARKKLGGISRSTLQDYRKSGRLPFKQISKKTFLYDVDEVEEFISKN